MICTQHYRWKTLPALAAPSLLPMLLNFTLRHRIPQPLILTSAASSSSLSTTSQPPPTTTTTTTTTTSTKSQPPRKARQSLRRILHLLSTNPNPTHSQNPTLSQTLALLQTSPHSLSPSQASTLISSISNPFISFDFYRFLKSLPTFKPNSTLFNSLITSQLQCMNPFLPKVQYFITEMRKHNVHLSSDDFRGFFELVIPKHMEIAEFLIRVLLYESEFDEGSYNFAISVYSERGFCEKAILVAKRVRARCENPSLGFYCCVMEVYRKNRDARAAMQLFFDMQDKGVVANERLYTVLLEILCGVGWVKLCRVIMQQMVEARFGIDGCLGVSLMRKFIEQNMVSEAEYLFREGVIRDKESLGVFVEAMAEKGRPLVGLELIKSVPKSGLDVDGFVYASLIRGCGKIGLIGDAEKIFSEIKSSKSIGNLEAVYSSMIYVYSRAEMKKMAEMVWGEMEAMNGFRVTEEAYICMMSMYGALRLVEDVLRLFDQLKRSGYHLCIDSYVILIDALSKMGKLNQARDFLLEMRGSGIYPTNSIYSLMMEGYLRVGLINHAIALIDEYKKSGLQVDEVVLTSVVKILIHAGKFSELESYLDMITKKGLKIPKDKGTLLMQMCRDDYCLRKLTRLIE